MTPKEYFQQLEKIDTEIEVLLDDYHRTKLTPLSSSKLSEVSVHTGIVSNPTQDRYIKLDELRRRTNKRVDDLVDLKIQIMEEIEGLDDRIYRVILKLRYIHELSWPIIAERISYEIRQVHRFHGEALEAFKQKYHKKDWK